MEHDDRHRPRAGCNWNQCGLDEPDTCPFIRDDKPLPSFTSKPACKHEWRQRFHGSAGSGLVEDGYYCIHCLEVTKN